MKRYVATGAVARLNRLVCRCDPLPGVEADKDQVRCRGGRPMILPAVTMLSTGLARQLPTSARIVTGIDPCQVSRNVRQPDVPAARGLPPNYQPRDTIGQQPTDHAWVNHGTETCRGLFVRMDFKQPQAPRAIRSWWALQLQIGQERDFRFFGAREMHIVRTHCGQIFAEAVFGGPALGPAMLSKRPQ